MIIDLEPLPFIKEYLKILNTQLKEQGLGLSFSQIVWIGFCLMGILLTNQICWAKFERMSLKSYCKSALAWMYRRSKICWDKLLITSTLMILEKYGIKKGLLIVDDKNIERSKNTSCIHGVYKVKDKKQVAT